MIAPPARPVLLVTVDTEEEWDWSGPFPVAPFSTRNIDEIPAFQSLCDSLEVRPTYFVDHAVAERPEHASMLRESFEAGRCDVGAHLHPWSTPPYERSTDERSSHAINLSPTVLRDKLGTLTEILQRAFGTHPFSYRAGRWGMNEDHLLALDELGYAVDSSVRYRYHDRDFDYRRAPNRPYRPDPESLLRPSADGPMLEIPATAGFTRHPFDALAALRDRLARPPLSRLRLVGLLWRLGLLREVTITPEASEREDLTRCIDRCVERGDRVINLFLHSSDLLPGCTPYVGTRAALERFLDRIVACVNHVRERHGGEVATVRELGTRLAGRPA